MKTRLPFSVIIIALFSCNNPNVENQAPSNQGDELLKIVVDYSAGMYEFSPISATFQGKSEYNNQFQPPINKINRAKQSAFDQLFLQKTQAIDPAKLSIQDRLTYDVFLEKLNLKIQGENFPFYQLPINQMRGMHNFYASLGSGKSAQPFNNEKDYRNFIQRSIGFAKWMDSVSVAMREGMNNGVVLPASIVRKLIPQVKTHLVDDLSKSVFYAPLENLPDTISNGAKTKLIADYKESISKTIIPAYQRLYEFLNNEYKSNARKSVGLSALPKGKKWYEFMIKTHTTLPLTAKEIHNYGLSEVERILAEMKKVKQQVGFKGSMPEFFHFLRTDEQFYFEKPEQLINAYENVKSKIDAKLPKLFSLFPKADYVVKPVPDFQAASSAGASYQAPAPDGTRPGIFYINTYNLKSQPKFLMETLSIHEAAPGHHFQIAIQQEVEGLPDFRKFGGYTVFNEGWALYAESLGKELGLFTDPYMWYGRLVDEQLRAMRLVVDTGLHAYGWSREKAIDYMLANSSMAESDVEAEVERYIVMPGQALAYKIGQRKIRQLRNKGEKMLGDRFNIKEFHTQILIDGSLIMPTLEKKIDLWIDNKL